MKRILCVPVVSFAFLFAFLSISFPVFSQSVGPDGSFGYSIPIDIPPGINGVAPKLSLEYNSNSGNGLLGVGWSVSGLPSIMRNTSYGINYNGTDHYITSDGDDLIPPQVDRCYHPKVENFSRFEAVGTQGDGPQYWIETKSDGTKLYYGSTSDSRAAAGNSVYQWALSMCQDVHGNYYQVVYTGDSGTLYPSKIIYTLNDNASSIISKYRCILFNYTYRSQGSCVTSYTYHTPVQLRGKLRSISIGYSTNLFSIPLFSTAVSEYDLTYQNDGSGSLFSALLGTDSSTGQSYLKNVTKISGSESVKIADFNYDTQGLWPNGVVPDVNPSLNVIPTSMYNDDKMYSGDFNGDGLSDVLFITPNRDGGDVIYLSNGSNGNPFSSNPIFTTWPSEEEWGGVGDFNGDGRDEVYVLSNAVEGNWMYSLTGSGFTRVIDNKGGWPSRKEWACPIDINGDGKLELYVLSSAVEGNWTYALTGTNFSRVIDNSNGWPTKKENIGGVGNFFGGGSGQEFMVTSSAHNEMNFYRYSPNNNNYITTHTAIPNVYSPQFQVVGDFNGDGLDDIFVYCPTSWLGYAADIPNNATQNCLYMSNGNDFTIINQPIQWPQTPLQTSTDDDGGPIYSMAPIPISRVLVGDFNGDGKSDLIVIYQYPRIRQTNPIFTISQT